MRDDDRVRTSPDEGSVRTPSAPGASSDGPMPEVTASRPGFSSAESGPRPHRESRRHRRGSALSFRTAASRPGRTDVILSVLMALMVLAGLIALVYPSTASWVSQYNQSRIVSQGVPAENTTTEKEDARQLALAERYNSLLDASASYKAGTNEPTSTSGAELHRLYEKALDAGGDGLMARIQIPSIDVDLPVYHGTSDATLLNGIGHLEGTSLPVGGAGAHAVLTGHRGLASATMFTNLNKVKQGDEFTVSTFGRVLTYKVIRIQVVDPDQTESLKAVARKDLVTLVTCTPLGINSQRIFVTGERIRPTPASAVEAAADRPDIPGYPWSIVLLVAGVSADAAWLRNALCPPLVPRHARVSVPRRP